MSSTKKIALFASGSGTNVANIIRYFRGNDRVEIVLVVTNKPDAGVISRAEKLKIPVKVFDRKTIMETDLVNRELKMLHTDLIVLAGFLLKIPSSLIKDFPDRMINIHPALLPKFGGKGMYGMRVHQAVLEARETKSGITIHKVNEHYDEGQILFQAELQIREGETPESLAARIHELEYLYYPKVIGDFLFSDL
ncbi:MAG: phosphoribosylglycinamide formyltransferase [Bacteroidales bacterium]|nr:phosphoribosylglycinamide formyltransferase [Bacteroidales bacterium]